MANKAYPAGIPSPGPHYAFLSGAPETREWASRGVPPLPKIGQKLRLTSPKMDRLSLATSSRQKKDIRPQTDWTFLVSGPLGGGQRRVVQRPWPEYVPESSAAVGRSWDTFNLSSLHEARPVRLKKMGYTHSPRATPRELARLASYPR